VSSHIPKLSHHSHVQSHAAVFKNNLCDSPVVRRGDRDCRWPHSNPLLPVANGSSPEF
jgi:hypothetical protein